MTYDYMPAAVEFANDLRQAEILVDKPVTIDHVDGEALIKFKHNGCDITINVGEFWAHPHEVCFFVNVHHKNGNFMCQAGTNRKVRAFIDLGEALHFANVSGDPLQSED